MVLEKLSTAISRRTRKSEASYYELEEKWLPLAIVAPTILVVFFVTIAPMLWSLWLTFHRWNPGAINPEPKWTGLSNYAWLFTSERFIHSVVNFAYYGGVGVVLQVVLGIVLALAIYNCIESRTAQIMLLTVFTLPMMYAPVVAGNIWQLIFLPGGGVVNGILEILGMSSKEWLGKRWLGLTSILIADTWQWVGLPLLIVYGGRVSLSESMYEAAKIDNASRWMMFRYITFPQLKNFIAIAAILRFMDIYKFFDKLLIMTRGGPGTATELPTYFIYQVGLTNFNVGRGATGTWIIGIGAMTIMLIFWRFMKTTEQI